MTGSAQLDFSLALDTSSTLERTLDPTDGRGQEPTASALRQQVAARLAAHRERRSQAASPVVPRPSARRINPIAERVAARYAQTPSYRAFLAEQARVAMEQAAAAAEIAMRNAEAVVAAQQELLGELELWSAPQQFTAESVRIQTARIPMPRASHPEPSPVESASLFAEPTDTPLTTAPSTAGLTVRLYEDLGRAPISTATREPQRVPQDPLEALALDAEIAFRQSPVFEDYKAFLAREAEPPVPIPANLLEFPRQLIAARKARPRLAEGPLRDEAASPATRQLRIFEVEAEHISTAPAPPAPAPHTTPDWHNIRLDAPARISPPLPEPAAHSIAAAETPTVTSMLSPLNLPQTAPLGLRAMAFLVDFAVVLAAGLAFATIFARVAGQIPGGLPGLAAACATLAALHIAYQLLFFTFQGRTPGMLYARIDFCTLSDENPTRSAMRRRILAQFIAALPLGLGLLWALLDEEGLGWHDRISRMYQRAY